MQAIETRCRKVILGLFLIFLYCCVDGRAQPVRGLTASAPDGIEGRRVALVIGNAAYTGQPVLKNPENDARDIGRLLEEKLRFQTEVVLNTDLRSLEQSIERFLGKLQAGDIGLFYFSGHGVQVSGENYLLPVGFDALSAADVKYQAYAASRVRDLMKERGTRLSILILDACRTNPYRSIRSGTGGLVGMSGTGAFIAFAADEGRTADDNPAEKNGLFTKHLLEILQTPSLKLSEVFDQVRSKVYQESKGTQTPFSYSGVIGDFFFSPPATSIKPIVAVADGPQRQPQITVTQRYGSLEISSDTSGTLFLDGTKLVDIQAYAAVKATDIPAGSHAVVLQTASGRTEKAVRIQPDATASLDFHLAPSAAADGARGSIEEVRRLHDQERWADSLPMLNRLVSEQPSVAEVFALRSHAYSHLERPAEALADGEQAVRLGPKIAETYLRRGEAKLTGGKQAEAIADFDRALQINPKEYEAITSRGAALAGTGQDQKALDSASQAIKLRGDRYEGWAVRGGVNAKLGNYSAAIDDLSQAIKLRPKDAELLFMRASAYVNGRQFDAALGDVNEAFRLAPDNPEVLAFRGAIYFAMGRREAAREDLSYSLRLKPDLTDAAELLKKLDAIAPSNGVAPAANTFAGGATAGLDYARLLDDAATAIRSQRNAEAAELVNQMTRLDPSRPDGWSLKGILMLNAFDNLLEANRAFQNTLDRGGTVLFRVGHDHGTDQAPCFGTLAINPAGVTYTGEGSGHQWQWSMSQITEAKMNSLIGVFVGMFHINAQRANYNFFAVRATDLTIVNRKPDGDMILGFINRFRQGK